MGWYHAKQILDGDVPSATLTDIVEPWFLGGGKDGPGGAEFAAFKKEHEGKVRFHASISDMPKPDGKMMAMVCTRTADMPGYVDELVDHGVARDEAHEVMREASFEAVANGEELIDVCSRTPAIAAAFSAEELEAMFKMERFSSIHLLQDCSIWQFNLTPIYR